MGNNLSQYARDRIYICKSNGGKDLNLSSCNIKKLPRRILSYRKTLIKLNVGKNQINEFYTKIDRFTLLQQLIAESNEIKEICQNLQRLESLTHFDISNNMVTQIPNNLKSLIHLNVSYNQITSIGNVTLVLPQLEELLYAFNNVQIFPTEILTLPNLKVLDLSGNRLNYLPDEISQLVHLESLNISENMFTSFPSPVASLSGSLKKLKLSSNNLGNLTNQFTTLHKLEVFDCSGCGLSSFDFDLAQLRNLEELYLSKNQIQQFSLQTTITLGNVQNLRILDLSQGQFKSIPKQLGWLPRLRTLNITQNQITKLPGELCLLNPSIDILLSPNPLDYPFSEWIKDSVPTLLSNLKPFMKCYGPKCSVSEIQTQYKSMTPNQFTINAFDYSGIPRVNGGDEFTVKMTLQGINDTNQNDDISIPDENSSRLPGMRNSLFIKSIDCIVKDNKSVKPGTYTVYFNSPQTGVYNLNITSDSLPIQGSPFTIELI